jgi:hypothetical protein
MALAFAGLAVASLTFARHAPLAVVPPVILWGLSAWGFIAPQQNRRCGRILRADRGRAIAARMAAPRVASGMSANSENDRSEKLRLLVQRQAMLLRRDRPF